MVPGQGSVREEKIPLDKQKQLILEYAAENSGITRKEAEELLHAGSTKAFRLLKELCGSGELEVQGSCCPMDSKIAQILCQIIFYGIISKKAISRAEGSAGECELRCISRITI